MSSRTYFWNGFETTLATQLSAGATSAQLTSTSGLTAPGYLLVDPDTPANREWIRFNGVSSPNVTSLVRNQAGSTGDNTHLAGVKVRGVFTKQQLDAIFTDIESVESDISTLQSDLTTHEGAADPHTPYIKADGTRAFTGTVNGVTPTLPAHLATKAYADTKAASVHAHVEADITDLGTYSPVGHTHTESDITDLDVPQGAQVYFSQSGATNVVMNSGNSWLTPALTFPDTEFDTDGINDYPNWLLLPDPGLWMVGVRFEVEGIAVTARLECYLVQQELSPDRHYIGGRNGAYVNDDVIEGSIIVRTTVSNRYLYLYVESTNDDDAEIKYEKNLSYVWVARL